MSTLANRIAKIEATHGANDMERYLNSLTDEALDARIVELDQSLRTRLQTEGMDCTGLSSAEVCAIVYRFEANGGRVPVDLENNQDKS